MYDTSACRYPVLHSLTPCSAEQRFPMMFPRSHLEAGYMASAAHRCSTSPRCRPRDSSKRGPVVVLVSAAEHGLDSLANYLVYSGMRMAIRGLNLWYIPFVVVSLLSVGFLENQAASATACPSESVPAKMAPRMQKGPGNALGRKRAPGHIVAIGLAERSLGFVPSMQLCVADGYTISRAFEPTRPEKLEKRIDCSTTRVPCAHADGTRQKSGDFARTAGRPAS